MRIARMAVLVGAAFVLLTGCTPPTDGSNPYSLTVAPKSITVDVPPSLVKPSATALSITSRGMGRGEFFNSEKKGAYHWVKESIWQSQKRLARAASRMLLLDTVIVGQGLVPGEASIPLEVPATEGIVWTQELVDAYIALIPGSLSANANFRSEAKVPEVGATADLPPFTYALVDKMLDPLYDVVVKFDGENDTEDEVLIQETRSFYWNTDKSLFKFNQELDDITDPAVPVILEQNFVAFDSATDSLAAGRQDRKGSMSLQLTADPASTTNGYFIGFDASISASGASDDFEGDDDFGQSGAHAGATLSFNAMGYADESGGTITETFTLTDADGTVTTFYFKESFDGTGHLTLAQTSTDGITYTPVAALSRDGAKDEYEDKEDDVETEHQDMESSTVRGEIKRETEHHAGEMGGIVDLEPELEDGQTGPVAGETWGVFSDEALVTLLGQGLVIEDGHVPLSFTERPSRDIRVLYLARLDVNAGNAPESATVLMIERD